MAGPPSTRLFEDTSPEAESVLIARMRALSPAQRVSRARSLSRMVVSLAMAAIRRANRGMAEEDIRRKFVEVQYGLRLPRRDRQDP